MIKGILRSAFDRVVEARERQVGRDVAAVMVSLDEQSLASLGTSRRTVRAKASTSYVF